jgi:hypothetical protein
MSERFAGGELAITVFEKGQRLTQRQMICDARQVDTRQVDTVFAGDCEAAPQ